MSLSFPRIRIGEPIRHESLTVYPLLSEGGRPVDYMLADEAISASKATVKEVNEQGTVPELLVENHGDVRILFLEGEELRGAKQNRVLNTSLLIPAKSTVKIPVSCVEQGRWRFKSAEFISGGTSSPSALRYALKASVTRSLKLSQSHRSDQGAVWQEVHKQQQDLGVSSPTAAMADTFKKHAGRVGDYQEKLKYQEGSFGVAVAIGSKLVSLDLFDKPSTCRQVWSRLLSGFSLDALLTKPEEMVPASSEVDQRLHEAIGVSWERAEAVGEGEEYRAEFGSSQGSALSLMGDLVHLSVMLDRNAEHD